MRKSNVKKFLILIFFLTTFFQIYSNTFLVFSFNKNLFKDKEFLIYSKEKYFSIDFDSLKNSYFIVVFDFSYRSRIFFGPSKIVYDKKSMIFDFNEPTLIRFNQLNELNDDKIFDDTTLTKISLINNLYDLNYIMYNYFKINISENELYFSFFNKEDDILKTYFYIKKLYEKKDFDSLRITFKKLYKKYPNNKDFIQFYLLSLLDCSQFYIANSLLDSYLLKFDDDTFYYSLKGNINAILGNLKKAQKYFEEGRKKYPESLLLLNDALNIYSILDSTKFEDYKSYLDFKFKR
ncbi:TPA: hypothetical protein DIT23_07415 [candidate division WOR-3 bacterium]|nr:hypothetical protein [candidate division WOR-3 bacterium]